ncbi:hypothetical protein H8959_013588 [Pygathrix nigripes]
MQPAKEVTKASDGSLLGDLGHTPLSKKEGVKWQRPRLSRQALMRCCLVKWILSSTAPQGSGESAVVGLSGTDLSWGDLQTCWQPVPDGPGAPWPPHALRERQQRQGPICSLSRSHPMGPSS